MNKIGNVSKVKNFYVKRVGYRNFEESLEWDT